MTSPTLPPGADARRPDVWAELRARAHVTRYRRCGAGRPVLMLADTVDPSRAVWPEMADALATHFRIVHPEVPDVRGAGSTASAFAEWLRDFVDGLGLPAVAVVAAEPFCVAALEFALGDAERVSCVVLVAPGAGDASSDGRVAARLLGDSARDVVLPVLVVRRGIPTAAALAQVRAFVADASA